MKLLLLLCLAGTLRAEVDRSRLLRCILQVEGHRWSDTGGAGAMREATWSDRTSLPYAFAHDPRQALPVYAAHLRWIEHTLHTSDVARIALAWRWGITGMRRHPRDDYGRRVENLYREKP